MSGTTVSIVIPVFNKWEYTAKCLRAVAEHTRDVSHEIIVIDNASSDETARALPRVEGIRYLRNHENLGFAKASNQGAAMATGRFLLFLNNDTEPHAGWASAMVAEMERDPAVAIVGSKLLYPDGTIQHAGVLFAYAMWQPIMPIHVDARRPAAAANARRELNAVTAACMLVRPEVFRAVGSFDEGYVNGYEDVDLCLQIRSRGGKIVFSPASVVTHHESVSEGRFDSSAANTERLMARWIERFDRPPFRFDVDFRRTARPLVVSPERPGASVVVVADRSIWTIAPCLENIWYTTGAQDEIVIVDVDDSADVAAGRFVAQFAARHPDRVRIIRPPRGGRALAPGHGESPGQNDDDDRRGVGFPRAMQAGLAAATRDLCALVGPNVRVVGDWIGRLAAHLRADQTLGAITATLGNPDTLATHELVAPVGRTDPTESAQASGGASLPTSTSPSASTPVPVAVTTSFTLFGRTDRLRALAAADPDVPFGANPSGTAARLAEHRLVLARAEDVVVYRLNEIAAGADPILRERYLELQGAVQDAAQVAASVATNVPAGGGAPAISVVVVAQGDAAMTRRCLRALRRHTAAGEPFEIILVDNGSDGGDVSRVAEEARDGGGELTIIRNPTNEGFAFACNQGLDRARGRVLAIVHDDVVVGPGWMRRALALLAADGTIGMVGPVTNDCPGPQRVHTANYDGAEQTAEIADRWAAQHQGEVALVPRLAGMCLVLRREVLMRVGGFDTIFGLGKGADDDYSIRVARAGWKLAIALDIFVHHQGGASYRRLGRDPRRAADAGWQDCCAKWNHPPARTSPADLAALGALPFDLGRDRVPLRYDHVYCPEVPPLALACHQPLRFLCIADEMDRADGSVGGSVGVGAGAGAGAAAASTGADIDLGSGAGWRGLVLRFVRAFTARDPVALVIRIEPATPGAAERALAEVSALLGQSGVSMADAPEVLFEATPLPPAQRGSLYTATRFFLRADAPSDPIRAREATACGLTLVDAGLSPAALRRTLSPLPPKLGVR